ncbi:uncharacterized protein CCR75_005611 [Bremia lactucae]|uniref:Uncharacterized protein n=1 Tax=Bremia lactucae TaxID=4779 RepID=A0A976IIX3_BRELC|nr:hypothetical protein CCR75_005611 [Bremia lactucae]
MPKSLLSSPKTPRAVLNVTQGRVMVTLENVGALRQTALADEHLMICICGVDVTRDCSNAQVLRDALQKMVRIKMQMGTNFTSDIDLLVAGVSSLIVAAAQEDVLDLDALMADVARYFDAQRQLVEQTYCVLS